MKYAPVLIPTLCRASHFKRLVESLKRNSWAKYTDIYIGLDFPPSDKYKKGWEEICNYLDNSDFSVFASFNVIKHESNIGSLQNNLLLRNHVFVTKGYDRYIHFDDDNEVSPNFLEYVDKCLDRYEDDDDVIAVCGYSYPIDWKVSSGATVLKQNVNVAVWGVGFWKKKHAQYSAYITSQQMIHDLPEVIRNKSYENMIDAAKIEYFDAACFTMKVGGAQKFMKCVSDIGLRAYIAISGKYAISPVISKVRNHGFDGSGTGCQLIDSSFDGKTANSYNYESQPIDTANYFEIIEDTLQAHTENREILNKFDYRPESRMARTRHTIYLCEHVGIWAAKIYNNMEFPYDFAKRALNKVTRLFLH